MNNPELVAKLTQVQGALWPTVSNAVSEACNAMVQMNSPLVLETQVEEVMQEFALPTVIVQFAFASRRDSLQSLILPLDTAAALAEGDLETVDDAALDAIRAPLEAIVQGICMSLGNSRNEIIVASDLSLRVGRYARPAGLQTSDPLVRIQVAVGAGSSIGALAWILDEATAYFVAGLPQPTVAPPFSQFTPVGASKGTEDTYGLGILMDVPLEISVELGRTRMVVKEVVDLGVGSIVEIEKSAGEPVDILVNGRLVARGEVVVIEDNFGVRITEILNPRERLESLGAAA